jgi:hypothetical protein
MLESKRSPPKQRIPLTFFLRLCFRTASAATTDKIDWLSSNYAAPSLLFCERGMQDLHLKPTGTQGKKMHCSVVRCCGRVFGEVGDSLDMALAHGGVVLYVRSYVIQSFPSHLDHVPS